MRVVSTIPAWLAWSALSVALAGRGAIAQAPDSAVVVFRDVTVIDGSGSPARSGMSVVIQGERILAVGRNADVAVPSGARVHDLSGKFVIPGLIDAHVHLAPLAAHSRDRLNAELDRMLHGGIVAMRVMAGPAALHASVRRAALVHAIPSPDVGFATVVAGPHFMAADPRTRGRADVLPGVAGAADVPAVVQEAARSGAIAVKLYAELDSATMQAAVAEARRLGLQVWAHATVFPDRPMATVRAGVNGVSHACSLAWQDPDIDPSRFPRLSADNRPTFDPELVDANGAEMRTLFQEMIQRHVVFDPTLFVQSLPRNARYGCDATLLTALTRAAHRAGVIIAAGTDSYADTADLFPALHQEIELLVSSGILTPMEAITAATLNGARALGRDNTEGTIAPGKVANLVVLDSDPSTDIRNLRSVASIMKRGRVYPRAGYLERRHATHR